MEQSTNYKHTNDFLISNIAPSIKQTQVIIKSKYKKKKCSECNKRRKPSDENYQICRFCYETMKAYNSKSSGNKVIDDFIRHTQINLVKKMEFVPYDQFKNVEFIAEGGFSKIYKAIWIDGPVFSYVNYKYKKNFTRYSNYEVVLKKLNDSKNVTLKKLNELKAFYNLSLKYKSNSQNKSGNISEYFGITQDPITQDIMIIMPYYKSGDLIHYVTSDFYSISWYKKLDKLRDITRGLKNIHDANIVHRDLHSGNIFFSSGYAYIGDLGISKSATKSTDDDENYGIIPYMAPEIFQKKEYTKASDIYSFGMIMWELMTGRRPFWDRIHDINLIIEIWDGLRPPIVTNAPEGYVELMKECWNSDPKKRPKATDAIRRLNEMYTKECNHYNKTKIIKSPDVGPRTINDPGAIYKSRPLSKMINSAMSLRSSKSQSTNLETDPFYYYRKNNNIVSTDKRKFEDNLIGDDDDNDMIDRSKRRKSSENEDNVYFAKEIELDINKNFSQPCNDEYQTKEVDLDIDTF